MWSFIVKQLVILAAGFGIAHFGDDYVKPIIEPSAPTVSPVKGVSWIKIAFWAVSVIVAALLVKFFAKKFNIKILK